RAGAVYVLLDDRHPVVREIARELELHARIIYRQRRRQDQRVAIPTFPETMDHGRHESQHTACALELDQGGPVLVEPVEDLRMNRVGGLDALLVIAAPALWGELRRLRAIQVGKGPRGYVALLISLGPCEGLEKSTPHNLEAFLRGGRPP